MCAIVHADPALKIKGWVVNEALEIWWIDLLALGDCKK